MSDSSRYAAIIERMPEGERPPIVFFAASTTWRSQALRAIPDDIALLALDAWFAEKLEERGWDFDYCQRDDDSAYWFADSPNSSVECSEEPSKRAAILAAAEREWQ